MISKIVISDQNFRPKSVISDQNVNFGRRWKLFNKQYFGLLKRGKNKKLLQGMYGKMSGCSDSACSLNLP